MGKFHLLTLNWQCEFQFYRICLLWNKKKRKTPYVFSSTKEDILADSSLVARFKWTNPRKLFMYIVPERFNAARSGRNIFFYLFRLKIFTTDPHKRVQCCSRVGKVKAFRNISGLTVKREKGIGSGETEKSYRT